MRANSAVGVALKRRLGWTYPGRMRLTHMQGTHGVDGEVDGHVVVGMAKKRLIKARY